MTQLERDDLHAEIEVRFPDNAGEQITPAITRAFLHELVDSAYLPASDDGAGYTDAQARAAQIGFLAADSSTVTFRRTAPYPPAGFGTYTLDPSGAVAEVVVTLEMNAATGAWEPDHSPPIFRLAGGKWKEGKTNTIMYYVLPSGSIEYSIASY